MQVNDVILNIGDNMSNMEYGKLLATYIYENIINTINPRMKLERDSKIGLIKKVSPEIPNGIYDISNTIDFESYNPIVERFKQVLDTKLSHCNNRAFYERIESLRIEEKQSSTKSPYKPEGRYYSQKNKIEIYLENIKAKNKTTMEQMKEEVVTHELLHMATTYKKGPIILCGFHQRIGKKHDLAYGLNEGYTELLNLRYFHHKNPSTSYLYEQLIALGIEQIVGRKKMESLYFDANLNGLVSEMKKYAPEEEIITLLKDIDLCKNIAFVSKETHINIAGQIRTKIANINMEKQRQLLMSGQITTDEYDYEHLKSAFYVKGYVLEKYKDAYGVRKYGEETGMILPKDGYRLVKKSFYKDPMSCRDFSRDDCETVENDIVNNVFAINYLTFAENRDLSQIESLENLDIKTTSSQIPEKILPKDNKSQELQAQLNEMFKRPPVEEMKNKRKIS